MLKFLNMFNMKQKLLLSTLIFLLPISILLVFVINGFDKDIDGAIKEQKGNYVLRPLIHLYSAIEIERASKLTVNETSDMPDTANQIHQSIFKALHEFENKARESSFFISKENMRYHSLDYSGDLFENYEKLLSSALNKTGKETPSEINAVFDSLTIQTNKIIRYIGDESGLILDPDLDSYYLMNITLLSIPDLINKLSSLNILVDKYFSEDQLPVNNFEKESALLNSIESDILPDIKRSLSITIREDQNFYNVIYSLRQNIPAEQTEFESRLKDYTIFLQTHKHNLINDTARFLYASSLYKQSVLSTYVFWSGISTELANLLKDRQSYYESRKSTAIIISGIATIVALLIILVIAQSMKRHLELVSVIAKSIADGKIAFAMENLQNSSKVGFFKYLSDNKRESRDEIVKLFDSVKTMTYNLNSLIREVISAALSVESNSERIFQSLGQFETLIDEQASSTNEVVATISEIAANTKSLAKSTDAVSQNAEETGRRAGIGVKLLGEINNGMVELNESQEHLTARFDDIKQRADDVKQIISTITKVAAQTNLLSLNAAIEAEKTSDEAKGFSVVAREIRRLADQTAVSALEIEENILEMIASVTEGVKSISEHIQKSKANGDKTNLISDQLRDLILKTNEIPEQVKSINEGMHTQTESAIQINSAMKLLSKKANLANKSSGELRNSLENMKLAIDRLGVEIQKFEIIDKR